MKQLAGVEETVQSTVYGVLSGYLAEENGVNISTLAAMVAPAPKCEIVEV